MTDKNHEQYLEQIEIAVAETTKEIMSKHNGDLRAMAKVCAEKQVEINRLKEYYNDDKKTIRNLRVNLKEATEEIECRYSTWQTQEKEYEGEIVELKEEIDLYKEELDVAHFEYDKIKEEKYSLYLKWSELKEEKDNQEELMMLQGIHKVKELQKEIGELKGEIDGAWSDYNTEVEMRSLAEKQLEELQNEHEGICSKYHADFCELEEKREEVMKLKEKLKSV